MKLQTLSIVLISLICYLTSCSEGNSGTKNAESNPEHVEEITEPSFPSLYVIHKSFEETDGEPIRTDSLATLSSDYYEVNLSERVSGGYYAHAFMTEIADKEGNVIIFQNSTEFLNFMSEHGYQFVEQSQSKYRTYYLFKRR